MTAAMANSENRENKIGSGNYMLRHQASYVLLIVMEAVLLTMVCLSPWAYGAVHPGFEFLAYAGVAVLVVLWGLRMLLEGQLVWKKCPVTLCLAVLFLIGIWQITPLYKSLLDNLSPAAARLYEELLPVQIEQLPFGERKSALTPPAGSTISLYPHATRMRLQRILAVLLVFAVVRHNLSSPGPLRRLAIVVLVDGALLSFFAFLQFFTSPKDWLYWSFPSVGRVFGPFIYRNHFAFFINLCIGLGLGVLWSRRSALGSVRGHRSDSDLASNSLREPGQSSSLHTTPLLDRLRSPLRLLHDPASLWVCAALALMMSSVVFSLSRGGFLALIGGFSVCLLITMSRSVRFLRLGPVLLSFALAIGLLAWFGPGRIEARFATLRGTMSLQESRLPLWSNVLTMARDFPILGTGYGTYQHLDPLYRTDAEFADLTVDHVHNDYLEILVESGMIGFLVSLLAIGLIYRFGYRAIRQDPSNGGLALGALCAFTTLVIHSIGDFGIHVPAITLLAAVLCAQLCGLGSSRGVPSEDPTDTHQYVLRWGGLAPATGAVICVALGWILCSAGWRLHQTESLRRAAFRAAQQTEPGSLERQRDYLEAAVRLAPDDADLRTELAEVYADLWGQEKETLIMKNKAWDAARVVLTFPSFGPPSGAMQPLLAARSSEMMAAVRRDLASTEEQRSTRKYLVPAVDHFLMARDRGPLLIGPHLGLALHADKMARADPPGVYRTRAQRLTPSDPALWYYCGNQELRDGQRNRAWKCWRRCLELSDRFLPTILDHGAKFLGPDALVREVLPDRPDLLLTAALRLYPRAEMITERSPFLQKALLLLNAKQTPLTIGELHTKAMVHKSLGQPAEAVAMYQTLLARQPLQVAWRYQFAHLLYEEGRLREARAELLTVLAQQPRHGQAFELLTIVTKGLLKKQ